MLSEKGLAKEKTANKCILRHLGFVLVSEKSETKSLQELLAKIPENFN
jgi:hypothetical protein